MYSFLSPGGSVLPASKKALHVSVVTTKPGGTGSLRVQQWEGSRVRGRGGKKMGVVNMYVLKKAGGTHPCLVISQRFAPLFPSSSFCSIPPWCSACACVCGLVRGGGARKGPGNGSRLGRRG